MSYHYNSDESTFILRGIMSRFYFVFNSFINEILVSEQYRTQGLYKFIEFGSVAVCTVCFSCQYQIKFAAIIQLMVN